MIIPENIECTCCHNIKPLSCFFKQKGGKYGYRHKCKECTTNYQREYRLLYPDRYHDVQQKSHEKNKERYKLSQQNYCLKHRDERRRTRLTTSGNKEFKGLNKRDYPKDITCEICGRIMCNEGRKLKLVYHHWDDLNPSQGIWTCKICHDMCEQVDKDLHIKYIELKKSIIKEV
jgi:hypothetical protein